MTGKQLRNSILQWAIQGKLVPQDPNDEPASVLLERIRTEKARLVKEKKIKRDKNESIIFRGEDNSYYEKLADGEVRCIDNEIPFEIPHGWTWCRLEHITNYIQRGKSPKYSLIKQIPVVAQKCNQWSGFQIENAQFIDPETLKSYSNERFLQDGDLMWNSTGLGTLGRMVIYRTDLNPYGIAVADSHVTVIRPFSNDISSEYLYAYFSSLTVQLVIEEKADGSTKQKELSTNTVKSYLVPLPPTDEQVRIVDIILHTKPIIDRYGNLYEHFTSVNNNLNTELRKSILQEAIQGRLVPQIESEGTAEQLLEEIEAEKMRLVKEGKLKKSALTASCIFRGDDNKYYEQIGSQTLDITEEIQYDIPENWRWCRLGDIATLRLGKTPPRGESIYWKPEKYNWVAIGDMKDGAVITQTKEFISEKGAELFQGRISPKGSLLMSFKLTIGKISELGIDAYHNEAIITILPFFAHLAWFKYILPMIAQCGGTKDAIKGKTLNSKSLSALLIPLPPLNEQRRIIPQIQALFDKIK